MVGEIMDLDLLETTFEYLGKIRHTISYLIDSSREFHISAFAEPPGIP
jgi:hypothetical protein